MPNLRKAKRTNGGGGSCSTPLRSLRKPADPEGAYCRTTSGCTATTATTAATNTSSRSIYSSTASFSEQREKICPVTGVYANISDDYDISPDIIGKGHYGMVRECIHRVTRQSFAVKSVDKSRVSRLDHLQREIHLLANMNHHRIMKMVDCYEDAQCVHIVTEKYTGGELFDKIIERANPHGCFSERKAGAVVRSLLEAVAYLHRNGVVHRDIKPENILFESNAEDAAMKLIDFGLSRRHAEGEDPMSNPVGTSYYMSPELLRGKYDKSTDIWSVGVVAYVLLCGRPPFNGRDDGDIRKSARRGRLHFRGDGWLSKSDEAVDFTTCLLRKDPRKRFTAVEALNHPWIRKMTTLQGDDKSHSQVSR